MSQQVRQLAQRARVASRSLAVASGEVRKQALETIAQALEANQERILAANAQDMRAGKALTEQGELLYRTAHEVFARLAMTEAMLVESKERPRGSLTVTASIGFSTLWLTPFISEFLDLYPEISMTVICEDRELDLGMREADVAIRGLLEHKKAGHDKYIEDA